jgi:oxygen-independent coproporphyrinogen-3 oxidase
MLCEPNSWLKKVTEAGAGIQKMEKISDDELCEELILMGLRLSCGIEEKYFYQHFQKNFSEIFDFKKLQRLEEQGLIAIEKGCIKIPHQQRLLSNSIIAKVVNCLGTYAKHDLWP